MRRRGLGAVVALTLMACESAAPPPPAPTFRDVSRAARVERASAAFDASVGDVDGDGRLDLFVANHGSPAVYLRNVGDGTFAEEIARTGIDPRGDQHGTALVDFDNDGDLDVYVSLGAARGTEEKANRLHRHDSDGRFVDVGSDLGVADPTGRSRTVAWLDVDRDGWLDLLLANYATPARLFRSREGRSFDDTGEALPLDDDAPQGAWADVDGDLDPDLLLRTGSGLRLLRNDGGRFVDRTRESGLAEVREHAGALEFADANGDGFLDLYLGFGTQYVDGVVVNGDEIDFAFFARDDEPLGFDFEVAPSRGDLELELFHNGNPVPAAEIRCGAEGIAEGTPARCPAAARAEELPDGSGFVLWRDPGPEGDLASWHLRWQGAGDHHLTGRLRPASAPRPVRLSDWQPRGGELWWGRGDGTFERASDPGLDHRALTQAVAWADLDNDGWLDLYVVDGGIEGASARNLLFLGRGDGRFVAAPSSSGATPDPGRGRGSAVHPFDYDGDGRLDLLLLNGLGVPPFDEGPYVLLHNEGPTGHWVEIRLRGTRSNRQGLGAWVEVEACGRTQKRYQDGGAGTLSQSAVPVHFGLGACTRIDDLVVRWPSGAVQSVGDLPADRIHEVVEEE